MEFALKIIIACWYKLLDNFDGSFHVSLLFKILIVVALLTAYSLQLKAKGSQLIAHSFSLTPGDIYF